MKRILITGATGFVGSNLIRHLSSQSGFLIFGHSREAARAKRSLADTQVQIVDTCSSTIFNELQIDTVIHLAGIAHDLSNQYNKTDYDRVNFENTKNVFDAFIRSNAKKFIFLSSIKAAIDTSSTPADETITPSPVTEYGRSKRKAEVYIQSVNLAEGKEAYIFRPCMIHGHGNKGNLNLLYKYAKTGMPFPFGSFENKRSFLSMDNLNFIVQSFLEKDIPSGIFHLADDGALSTKELFRLISEELNKKPRIWHVPAAGMNGLFSMVGKRHMLDKLTEDMLVSNHKLLQYIAPLPLAMRDGLKKTIRSFHAA